MNFFTHLKTAEISESDHLELLPQGRKLSSDALKDMNNVRISAVGIHGYVNAHGKHEIILIRRSEYEGKHSGQIAFPGGKMEANDLDLISTARRESEEEIGINAQTGELIRSLSTVYIPVSNFSMTPYVFYHERLPEMIINEREVQHIIQITLEDLCENIPIEYRKLPMEKGSLFTREVPGFLYGDFWIWGATALVLNQLKKIFSEWIEKSR